MHLNLLRKSTKKNKSTKGNIALAFERMCLSNGKVVVKGKCVIGQPVFLFLLVYVISVH